MTIWQTASVEDQPDIILECWCIVELDDGTRHFVGYNVTDREGRVSTDIVGFDPKRRCGTTSSGRNYKLLGRPGHDQDGLYVLQRWARLNMREVVCDVTEDYLVATP